LLGFARCHDFSLHVLEEASGAVVESSDDATGSFDFGRRDVERKPPLWHRHLELERAEVQRRTRNHLNVEAHENLVESDRHVGGSQ